MPKKVEKPIIPTPNKEVAPLKKEELLTDKGQGLEDAHSPKTSENKAQTQAKVVFLNMGKKKTTAKKVAKTAGAQKGTSKKK